MAYEDNQSDIPLPQGNDTKRKSAALLPKYFRTAANRKFLESTVDQLIQPGVIEKVDGYLGRKTTPAFEPSDSYLPEVSPDRQNYQLEPAVVLKDNLNNIIDYTDYIDLINTVSIKNGQTINHDKISKQEYYAWNPMIEWDKFVNFRQYYWLPNGPQSVPVLGLQEDIESTLSVTLKDNGDNFTYVFTPNGFSQNPSINLYRGQTYKFEIDSIGNPFTIKTRRSLNSTYNLSGVTQNVEQGVVEFTPDENTPNTLYYSSATNLDTGGIINVFDLVENSSIDVEKEILGKKYYTTSDGWSLTNGMKVYFLGNVTPEKYAIGEYYVEGVGTAIKLVSEQDLQIPANYSQRKEIPFDTENFDRNPFGTANSYNQDKDYIVINRASPDGNAWTRYNRWFHIDTITRSAEINNQPVDVDQSSRARRPIIEFESGIKLYNMGWKRKTDVDLIDTKTKDIFSIIEGSQGYNIDSIALTDGMRILFTAEEDVNVKNKVFQVKFINFGGSGQATNRQISLIEVADSNPVTGENVLVTSGNTYSGKIFFYDGTNWISAQEKTQTNQSPLFDLFDKQGNSIGDKQAYETPNFRGNKIFAYSVGEGINDPELGFPLNYRSIENVGDITFTFDLLNDTYQYQDDSFVFEINSDICFVKQYDEREDFVYKNGWTKAWEKSTQRVVFQHVVDSQVNDFEIIVYDKPLTIQDVEVNISINGSVSLDWQLIEQNSTVYIRFDKNLNQGDNLVIKTKSQKPKNTNGYYAIPSSLEKNPLNNNINQFTLGEVNDHVTSIIEELENFEGINPGVNNLRDLGNISKYGQKFVQNTDLSPLSIYLLSSKQFNIIEAIDFAGQEYEKFKRQFIQVSETLGFDGEPRQHVDAILSEMFKTKRKSDPFYFSDMVPFGGAKEIQHIVYNTNEKFYAMSEIYSNDSLTEKAVLVYLNNTQLTYSTEYTFNDQGFVEVLAELNDNDIITIYEYENTDGNYIPPTPSKLGIFPKYIPEIFVDNSYLDPQTVIRGHDGSKLVAYGDYRDSLLLELEKRIYNNIKQDYNKEIFDIFDYLPSEYRKTDYTLEDIDRPLISDFISWLTLVASNDYLLSTDYTTSKYYEKGRSFTYNYGFMSSPSGKPLPGWWRRVYDFAFDTPTPHLTPWEMLGYKIQPKWWTDVYGPAPYTKENLILWEDLQNGIHRIPGQVPTVDVKFKRPNLLNNIPVDSIGNLLSPLESSFAKEYVETLARNPFKFGDAAPAENAWRNSSSYNFSFLKTIIINNPMGTIARLFDVSRMQRDIAGNLVYAPTEKRIQLKDIVFPNTANDADRVTTSGLINYITNYVISSQDKVYDKLKSNIKNLNVNIGSKLAGFSNKAKFKLILDSRTPYNQGNVFVPDENYNLFVNTSKPIKVIPYSGVLIEKQPEGFIISGYDTDNPVFISNQYIQQNSDRLINVGGITEPYRDFALGDRYTEGDIVRNQGKFYIAKSTFTANSFDKEKWQVLPSLPTKGGVEAVSRSKFDSSVQNTIPYGTLLLTIQDVVDFILGYADYLKDQGFVFDYFNKEKNIIENWMSSVKEFMFWTTENWASGSVITLSPGANQLKLKTTYSVVDDVFDIYAGNTIYSQDGRQISQSNLSIDRSESNTFIIRTRNDNIGIYHINLPIVQTEHILVLDNQTVFRDIIYDQEPGYRQERIRVLGYRSDEWSGSLNIPGFVYDPATTVEWEQYTDYNIGALVQYKEFYYVAKNEVSGKELFDRSDWQQLTDKPEPTLYTNFDYRINQFADFYDLDSDNFDAAQQKLAQHLIGYQKRQYLQNIINDDVSQFKFYQGMIQEKGSANSLIKLFDALASADKDSLEFYEEWAIRTGQYGASRGFEEVEFILNEKDIRLSPQPVELVNTRQVGTTDLVIRQLPADVYLKPEGYTHTPFPTDTYKNITEYVPTAGYVRPQDVTFSVLDKDQIVGLDITQIESNEYLWIGVGDPTWSVEKHVQAGIQITAIESSIVEGGTVDLILDTPISDIVFKNDIIGINDIDQDTNGFYKVVSAVLNRITINDPAISTLQEANGYLSLFRNNRLPDLNHANLQAEKSIDDGEILWVDDNNQENWTVIQNNQQYKLLQRLQNPNLLDDSSQPFDEFGASIAVNTDNTVMVVGSPKLENGVVQVFTRATNQNNMVFQQTLGPPGSVKGLGYDGSTLINTDEKFGTVVEMSPDGIYMAVGSPYASNISSEYRGNFDDSVPYSANEIVKYQESYWKARFDIQAGATGGAPYLTNTSFAQFAEDVDSTQINLLNLGNYRMGDTLVDHMLVRAPTQMFNASSIGDTIVLKWNEYTGANTGTYTLQSRTPFNGLFNEISSLFLTDSHTILRKVDHVFYVDSAINIPIIGETVSTTDASSKVVYVATDNARCVIYTYGTNGQFAASGELLVNGTTVVGDYLEDFQNVSNKFSGYWMIGTAQYNNSPGDSSDIYYDAGNGLVYQDLIPASENRAPYEYYNVADNIIDIGPVGNTLDDDKDRISNFGNLSYQSAIPHTSVPLGIFESNLWFFKAPIGFTDKYNVGADFYFYALPESLYNNNDPESIPPYASNITDDISYLNKRHEIYDIWDGYIEIEVSGNQNPRPNGTPYHLIDRLNLDLQNNPIYDFALPGSNIDPIQFWIRGSQGGVGRVVWYQSDGNKARIYLKDIRGDWTAGNIGAQATVERFRPGVDITRPEHDFFPSKVDLTSSGGARIAGDIGPGGGVSEYDSLPTGGQNFDPVALVDGDDNAETRVYGRITKVAIGNRNNNVGKIVVAQRTEDDLSTVSTWPVVKAAGGLDVTVQELKDIEYWVYIAQDRIGAVKEPQYPVSSNLSWEQVYNLKSNQTGQLSGLTNQGIVHIYRRNRSGTYSHLYSFISEKLENNIYFGSKIKIIQYDDTYYMFVSAKGTGNAGISQAGTGFIQMYKFDTYTSQGQEISEFVVDQDPLFRGIWSSISNYSDNEIVLFREEQGSYMQPGYVEDGYISSIVNEGGYVNRGYVTDGYSVYVEDFFNQLYEAKTNLAPAAVFNPDDWSVITGIKEYNSILPNRIGQYINDKVFYDESNFLVEYARDFDVNANGHVLVVSSVLSGTNDAPKSAVLVYRLNRGHYELSQTIFAPNSNITDFGSNVSINNDGKILTISEPFNDENALDQGKVYVYTQQHVNGQAQFVQSQVLKGAVNEAAEMFGYRTQFSENQLAVTSRLGNIKQVTTFDSKQTTFDNLFTTFQNTSFNTGAVSLYENINDTLVYAGQFNYDSDEETLSKILFFGENMKLSGNHLYVGLPTISTDAYEGLVIDFSKPKNTNTWSILREPVDRVNLEKIKGAYLYDTKSNQLLANLDYIDPIQGKVAGIAEQELSYKTYYDPALYNISNNSNVVIDTSDIWDERYVGQLWWDLSAVRFISTYQGDITFQTNNFNSLFPGTDIDIYEWVESEYLPSIRDELALTIEGEIEGITGQSKYGDSSYVEAQKFDRRTGTFVTRYYYWVKAPTTVPNVDFRSLSAFNVQNLIKDPVGQGYKFVALLGNNRFALANCQDLITTDTCSVNIQYYTIDNINQNIHNQYQLITDGLSTSTPNNTLFAKWTDSLVGYDKFFRPVPDPDISPKIRYGIENKPRQSMFVNRFEALKQVVERSNQVFSSNIMVDDFDLSPLFDRDAEPTPSERKYDAIVDTDAELDFVGVANVQQAILTPVIENGKIIDVIITDPGRGYIDITYDQTSGNARKGPSYTITGTGNGAVLDITLDNLGKITQVQVINGGERYEDETVITIRPFSVLVRADSFVNGRWAIYTRAGGLWNRVKTQDYDVTNYWQYIDYYAEGYNKFTEIDYTIDQSYQLSGLDDRIGDIIKVQSVGGGSWLLLEKIAEENNVDYTINYKTIGKGNGTIELLPTLYDISQSVSGFDTVSYDTQFFDNQPIIETRVILETIKNNLFVDNLALEFNQLFFATVRYVLSEQNFVDWIFKTSFVKAKHNVGELSQRKTFKNDSLPSYQDYIDEVKPYKSKIREYISSYEKQESTSSVVTDFDLFPEYDASLRKILPESIRINNNEITGASISTTLYPKKHWVENFKYEVSKVAVKNPGSNYVLPPKVTLVGGGGSGATARALLSGGKVSAIIVENPGRGYTFAPEVVIEGSITEGGFPATAFAQLKNTKVRGTLVTVKFDRLKGEYEVLDANETETFAGTGSQLIYNVKWPFDLTPSKIQVLVDNVPALTSEYTYENLLVANAPYEKYHGRIVFVNPPADRAVVEIKYQRSNELLDAADRINQYYNPTSGMLGKELGQLMTGIDYGGVEVKSFDFGTGTGWDSDGWYTKTWDTYDTTYEDEVFQLDPSTVILELSKPLADGVIYNVYRKTANDTQPIRIDDPGWFTSTGVSSSSVYTIDSEDALISNTNIPISRTQAGNPLANPNALMPSLVGDGIQNTFDLTQYNIPVEDNDVIIIRKSTSDGSFIPDPESYDSQITGGNLAYDTAKGINADEINIDGDGFVTPTTSKGPEELVPGQVLDTLDIQVYDRVADGGCAIDNRNYIVDGNTNVFEFDTIPNTTDAVFVKVENNILLPDEYETNFANKTITLLVTPAAGARVNIIVMGVNGEQILDIDTFTGDGSTTIFSTRVSYDETYSYIAKVNGEQVNYVLAPDDNGFAAFVFGQAPGVDTVITFGIFYSERKDDNSATTYSEVVRDKIIGDGSSVSYKFSTTPFTRTPLEHNVIVIVDNKIQRTGYNFETTLTTTKNYQVETWQVIPGTIDTANVAVYLNGVLLKPAVEYRWNVAQSEVILFAGTGNVGDKLEVFILDDGVYTINGDIITFDSPPADNSVIEIIQFSEHDVLKIERLSYQLTSRIPSVQESVAYYKLEQAIGGKIQLRQPAQSARFVWLSVNGNLLIPSRDYYVTDDKLHIQVVGGLSEGDYIDIIHFTEPPITGKFGYRQFKDMLNRTHFKRIGDANKYYLTQPLYQNDLRIHVNDASTLPEPSKGSNIPGVVFINGERIEYFVKEDNMLRQLRRGTLGTGIPTVHAEDTDVYDQSINQTIPYKDETLTQIFTVVNNEQTFTLDWTPQSNDEFEVFLAGKRLRKNAIDAYKFQSYNDDGTVSGYLDSDSPSGDVRIDAEFNIIGNTLTVNQPTSADQKVIIIRKIGKSWTKPGVSLRNADNEISRFLRAEEVDLPK